MVKRVGDIDQAALRFLKSGKLGGVDPFELATACDKIIRAKTQQSNQKALKLAQSFLANSRRHKEMPIEVALRCQAWVLHSSGKYRPAEKAYLKARQLVVREPLSRARIDRILIDVYMYMEDFNQARRHARLALATFERLGENREAAMTRVNYGNLFHRLDRHREAYAQYQQARKVLEREGGKLVLALCYYNLANASVQLFEFDQAEDLYEKARKKFEKLGYELYVNESSYGLAWLRLLQGEYYIALKQLAACEKFYHDSGQPRGEVLCQLDRAEAYLALGLFPEASTESVRAARGAAKLKLEYEAAKGAFYHSIASRGLGHSRKAQVSLDKAVQGFEAANNPAFVSAAKVMALTSDKVLGRDVAKLKRLRKNLKKAQLPLWEAICDINLLAVMPEDKNLLRRMKQNRAIQSVPHLNSLWKTFLGDREARRGRTGQAVRYWTQAAELLDATRAKLPPIEMRSALMRSQGDPLFRLIGAETDNDPAQAAAWSERLKTTGQWAAPTETLSANSARQKVEQNLARLASQVTALSTRIDGRSIRATRHGQSLSPAMSKFQSRVGREWVELETEIKGHASVQAEVLNDIAIASMSQPVVQFHCDGHDLIAFVHHQGNTRAVRYPNGNRLAAEFAGCWSLTLSRSLLSSGRVSRKDLNEENRLFADLGDWLWSPLELPERTSKVLIVPEGKLTNIPWLALIHDGRTLAEKYRITVSPSIRHHLRAASIKVRSNQVSVFVGQSEGLRSVSKELSMLEAKTNNDLRIHRRCQHQHWPRQSSARLWHYAGHANYRSDNPFYSSLQLYDRPMFANEFRLMNNKVGLVTLAACRTGCQSVLPGEESTGLVRSLLEMGARNVVGSHWSVADRTTSVWMQNFYDSIFERQSVSESVRQASLYTREHFPSAYDWAAFSVFGAG